MAQGYEWLLSLQSLIAFSLIGMLMHFFKKKIKGETFTEITQYFKNNFKSTVISFISTVVTLLIYHQTLGTEMPADIMAAIGIGYTSDSVFNKWD
jgi:hypothetical protein